MTEQALLLVNLGSPASTEVADVRRYLNQFLMDPYVVDLPWPLRRLLFRPDRGAPPQGILPVAAIAPDDGWCDDAGDPAYNRPVKLPFGASHEAMWRTDHLYDLVVVVGHNDSPPVAGAGSAIFLHLARPDRGPTAGCVAFSRADLEAILVGLEADSHLLVVAP